MLPARLDRERPGFPPSAGRRLSDPTSGRLALGAAAMPGTARAFGGRTGRIGRSGGLGAGSRACTRTGAAAVAVGARGGIVAARLTAGSVR